MLSLALAAVTFAAMHLLISGTRLRDALAARLGERLYLALFSLASAVVLFWLIDAYGDARRIEPTPLLDYRWIAVVLNAVAFLMVALGLLTPSPTAVAGGRLLAQPDVARGMHRITRHPFLWGVALWAATHLAFNISAANVLFFGSLLLVAVAGTASIDAKRARRYGENWLRYAKLTSNLPFAAILQRRNRLALREFGALKILAALIAFAAAAAFHARLFGVAPF